MAMTSNNEDVSLIDKLNAWKSKPTSSSAHTEKDEVTTNIAQCKQGDLHRYDPSLLSLRESIVKDILSQLPAMIREIIENKQITSALTAQLPASITQTTVIEEIKKEQDSLMKKIDGFKIQATKWINITKNFENTVLPDFKQRIEDLEKSWSTKEKALNNKTKNYLFTHTKMNEQLEDMTKIKNKLQEHLEGINGNGKKLSDIDQSQKYVSAEYDEIKAKQDEYESELKEMKRKLEYQEKKTEHTANYSRLDCLEVSNVPYALDRNGVENCKWQIIEICKELHYWIPEHSISTAHRKKQHPSKSGPPPIIVKFNCKDIRNDVFKLRSQLKEKKLLELLQH